jgi:hypothetical protein
LEQFSGSCEVDSMVGPGISLASGPGELHQAGEGKFCRAYGVKAYTDGLTRNKIVNTDHAPHLARHDFLLFHSNRPPLGGALHIFFRLQKSKLTVMADFTVLAILLKVNAAMRVFSPFCLFIGFALIVTVSSSGSSAQSSFPSMESPVTRMRLTYTFVPEQDCLSCIQINYVINQNLQE